MLLRYALRHAMLRCCYVMIACRCRCFAIVTMSYAGYAYACTLCCHASADKLRRLSSLQRPPLRDIVDAAQRLLMPAPRRLRQSVDDVTRSAVPRVAMRDSV